MKKYTFKLLAGEPQTYGIVGKYIHIFAAIGDLTIKTDNGDMIVLPQLTSFRPEKIFTSLTISSQIDQTIEIYAGFGSVDDLRTIIFDAVDTAAGTDNDNTVVVATRVGAIAVPAANNYKEVYMFNMGLIPVYIGTARGLLAIIAPNGSFSYTRGAKLKQSLNASVSVVANSNAVGILMVTIIK